MSLPERYIKTIKRCCDRYDVAKTRTTNSITTSGTSFATTWKPVSLNPSWIPAGVGEGERSGPYVYSMFLHFRVCLSQAYWESGTIDSNNIVAKETLPSIIHFRFILNKFTNYYDVCTNVSPTPTVFNVDISDPQTFLDQSLTYLTQFNRPYSRYLDNNVPLQKDFHIAVGPRQIYQQTFPSFTNIQTVTTVTPPPTAVYNVTPQYHHTIVWASPISKVIDFVVPTFDKLDFTGTDPTGTTPPVNGYYLFGINQEDIMVDQPWNLEAYCHHYYTESPNNDWDLMHEVLHGNLDDNYHDHISFLTDPTLSTPQPPIYQKFTTNTSVDYRFE